MNVGWAKQSVPTDFSYSLTGNMPHYLRSFTQGGTFFFTVTLADRQSATLIQHIDFLRISYQHIRHQRPFRTVAISILPDHLHAIWKLPDADTDYSLRWSLIKAGFSRKFTAAENRSASKAGKREKGIWQRRYWEHQIRDEDDLEKHVNYIHINPVHHGLVSRVKDWPYSSFHRYVGRGWLPPDWAGCIVGAGEYGE